MPGENGLAPSASPATGAELGTFNLQLRSASLQALSPLISVITADGATVTATTIPGLYVVQTPDQSMGQIEADLSSNPAVAYAEPVHELQIQTVPSDPDYTNGDQWQFTGPWGVNAPAAWNVTTGSDQVIVADVDTGLEYNIKDIYDNVWLNQPEIPANVIGNLTDVNNDGVITFTDLNNPANQGAGKIEDANGDGLISGTDVLASTSVGGWVNSSVPDTQDGDTADPGDFIGWNFVNDTNNPMDGEGHGSFTASEIAEMANNSLSGAGLVWNTQIMPVAFLDSSGSGTDTAAAEAIEYAVNHGARVINASWGGAGTDSTIEAAIAYADAHGVIIVAAAGNNGTDDDTTFFSPASYSGQYPNVISVAAIGSNGARANFSNYGAGTVQLAAPGVNVYSATSNGGFGTMSGTSMAAPLVTGAVALVEAAHPSWTMSQVVDAILDTVTTDPALAGEVSTGGVLNVGAAVANTDGPYVVSATPDGSINTSGGFSTVQLTFNEEINPATFTSSQVTFTGPGGVIPAADLTITPVSGSNDHEFQISFPSQSAAGTYKLTAGPDIQDWYGNDMNQNRNGANGEPADAFTETIRLTAPGSTDLLSITGIPSVTPAGTGETFTVTALSPNGGTDASYVGTVQFTSTDSQAVLPANYHFAAANDGTHTFAVTFKTAGSQSITATDTVNPAIAGTEENFIVSPGAATSLNVAGFPTSDTAAAPHAFTVTALDTYGNVATGYSGTITFTSSDSKAKLPANAIIVPEDQGTASFTATLKTVGMQSITATDLTTSTITGSESNISVELTVPKSLAVTGFPATVTAGTAGNVTVTAYNADGTVATGYTGTVDFSSTDGNAVLPTPYTFTTADAGTHTFSVTLETAGSQSITVTDSSTSTLTDSETGITVQPAALAKLVVSGFPSNPTAGTAHNFTVTATDAFGNVITGYLGTVNLSSSDPNALFSPVSYAFTTADAGTHSFSATLETAGAQSITANDTTNNVSGAETGITVQPAPLAKLIVAGFPTNPTAGTAYTFTVSATDAYGNVITGYVGTVNLSSSDPNAVFSPSSYTFDAGDDGTHSFSATLETAGTQSIKASDTNNNVSATETGITVQPAALAKLVVSGFPTSLTAGTAQSFTVTATDSYGNVITGYRGTVNLSSSDSNALFSSTSFTFTAADSGSHSFTATLKTAGAQSITATDTTNGVSGTETGVTVKPAAVHSFTVSGFPANPTAGTAYNVTVTAYDAYNNVATGYRGTVNLSSTDSNALFSPSSFTFTAANSGTHSFSATLKTAGPQSIKASDTNNNISGTETGITVQPAAVQSFAVSGFPANPTAGTAYNVTVAAYDAFNNVVTGYRGTVNVSSTDANGLLSPSSYTFTAADSGSHSFSATLKTAGARSIEASDTNDNISGTEAGITVQPAAAQSFAVSGFPANPIAGTAYNVTVTAHDAYNNVASGYTGTVDLSSTDPNALFAPSSFIFTAADAGSHVFSATLETAGGQSIKASDTTNNVSGTDTGITVQPAAAHVFTVSGFPANPTAGTAYNVTVTAYDAYNNVATGYRGTVNLGSTDPNALFSPSSFTFIAENAGSHSFAATLETAGAQSINVSDTTNNISGTETGITVQPAAAHSFAVSGFPTDPTAGTAYNVTITAYDAYNNVATGYAGTVKLNSTDPNALFSPASFNFTAADAGSHSFAATLETAGAQSINASDTTGRISGSETGITVQPAAANSFTVSGFPANPTAGTAYNLVVTVYDAYDNVATGYRGTVNLSSTDLGALFSPSSFSFTAADSGSHSFSATLKTAGAQSITATDNTNDLSDTETGITVQAAAAHSFTVNGFPANPTAGTAYNATVTAYDAYRNVATGYRGTLNLSSTDPNAVFAPSSYTFTAADAGSHAFAATLKTAGGQSITAADTTNGVSGTETGITVEPAAAHSFTVSGFPTDPTAGTAYSVTVTAYDAYNNVATGYAGTVNLSSTDPNALLSPSSFAFAVADGGTHTFSVTLKTAGPQSITARDANESSITGVESSIVVAPASASVLVLSGYPSTTAGAVHNFTVTAVDPYGNVATGYTGTIHFESSDDRATSGSGLPPDYTFRTGAGQDNGEHVFSAVLKTAGTQSITAHDLGSGTIAGTQSGIIVSPATATRLVFGQEPTAVTAGVAMTPAPKVQIEDAYGNVVTGDSSTVTLTLAGGTFEGGSSVVTASASGGVATFSGLKIDRAGSESLSASDGSLAPGANDSFTVSPAAGARLVFHTQPSSTALAGQEFTIQPQVFEVDQFGNLETLDSRTVVTASSGDGEGTLQGRTGVTVSGGIATFTNLDENTAGTISLTVNSGTLVPAVSKAINVMAAPATQLVVTTPPPSPLIAGQSFTLVVAAKDPYGNVDPTFNGNVTVSIPNDPSFTTTTVAAQDGVATFVGLTLNQSASGATIHVTANGLSAAVTSPVQLPQAPTIISEQVVMFQKKNKKGKKVGKPVFQGFALVYSEPMNPTSAGLAANYQVATTTKKRIKKKTVTVLKPVSLTAVYHSATDTVTLAVKGKPNFAKGGQLTVTASSPGGVTSSVGEPLDSSDTKFIISAKAKRIQGPA